MNYGQEANYALAGGTLATAADYADPRAQIAQAPSPPLTDRIEKLLDAAYGMAMEVVGSQNAVLMRLFGPEPPVPTGSGAVKEPHTFEDRVFARLQTLLAVLGEASAQANRLNSRI